MPPQRSSWVNRGGRVPGRKVSLCPSEPTTCHFNQSSLQCQLATSGYVSTRIATFLSGMHLFYRAVFTIPSGDRSRPGPLVMTLTRVLV